MTKRVLMVLTNHGVVEGTDKPTGWYLPECTHPYTRFKQVRHLFPFFLIFFHTILHLFRLDITLNLPVLRVEFVPSLLPPLIT